MLQSSRPDFRTIYVKSLNRRSYYRRSTPGKNWVLAALPKSLLEISFLFALLTKKLRYHFLTFPAHLTIFNMSKNPIFAILWLLLLWFISWPIAGLCAGFWILLQVRFRRENAVTRVRLEGSRVVFSVSLGFAQPFEACFNFLKPIQQFLEKLITWPRDIGTAIANCQSSFPAPF